MTGNPEYQDVNSYGKFTSPPRLRLGIDMLLSISKPINSIEVEGRQKLEELIPGEPVIIAVTHGSGFDVPLAIKALGSDLDMVVTDQSTHHSFDHEKSMHISQRIVGRENFIPISYQWRDGRKIPSLFEPTNTVPMIDAMEQGKSVLLAVHNPLALDENSQIKTVKPGYMATYLALQTGATILPVGIALRPTGKVDKYDANINIGTPFKIEHVPEIERLQTMMSRRSFDMKLDADETKEFNRLMDILKCQSAVVFSRVIELQPTATYDFDGQRNKIIGEKAIKSGRTFIGDIC